MSWPDGASGPTWCEERSNRSRKGKAYERREGEKRGNVNLTNASGSGRRTQRPQVHASAEQIYTVIQTCAPGPEIIGGGAPGNPTTTQRSGRGWERTSKGAQRGMPTPGRPERSGLCEDDDPGIFGYFPSMESTSPGGEISPVRGPVRTPAPTEWMNGCCVYCRGGPVWPPAKPSPPRGEGGIAVGDDG